MIPHLPVAYFLETKLPGKPTYQVTIDPWFQINRELEDKGYKFFYICGGGPLYMISGQFLSPPVEGTVGS